LWLPKLNDSKAIGDEREICQAGIAGWIKSTDMIVAVGGGKINRHGHGHITPKRGAGVGKGIFCADFIDWVCRV